ncbi:hypothetical protein GN244_ATG19555 [Phytophthora infestans]|uniref:Uncharacterized protein n=1 Tax=Phytophthora infestans TaxID=4787 RepID=A0A833RYH9_PHYIN|nr:hypothetical protein GN244_ATG19555 [Phytophthora infestans]
MFDRWTKKPAGRVQASKAIPVPLLDGETLLQYTRKFERWLLTKHETFASLRGDPSRERGFWFSFAHIRADTCGNMVVGSKVVSLKRDAKELEPFYESSSDNSNKRLRYSESPSNDREKSSSQSLERRSEWGNTTRANPTKSRDNELHHVVKEEDESSSRYESAISCQSDVRQKKRHHKDSLEEGEVSPKQTQKKLATRIKVPVSAQEALKFPKADVQRPLETYWHHEIQPIELQFETKIEIRSHNTKPGKSCITSRPAKTTISPISPLNDEHEKIYCEPPPVWAAQLIKQVHDLQNQVEQLQEEVKTLRKISVKPCSSCGESEDKDADTLEALKLSTIPAKMGSAALAKTFSVDIKNEALVSGEHTAETENTTGVEQRILVPSVADGSVKDDPEKRKLMAEYDYINMQIMANQTAIDDALVYVKTLKQVDEASAAEHHSQIMELVVSVNQEKEKRASALAVLIVYCWSERHEQLQSMLDKDAIASTCSTVKHEKWAAISSQIEEKDAKMKKLEAQLNDEFQAVKASHIESDSVRHLKSLQAEKVALEEEQQQLLVSFLQDDDEIQKLVKKLLAERKCRLVSTT